MRLRTLLLIAGVLAMVASIVWSYGTGMGKATAVGAGGLPLIKADANPAKVPPEEGSESEIIPNAESTVFAAMGTEDAQDPSMENITPPEDEPKTNTEFAGFRTGFALPKEAPRKTESLFKDTEEQETKEEAKTETDAASQYFSGVAPEAVSNKPEPAPVAVPEPETEPLAKTEAAPAPQAQAQPEPEPVEEPVVAEAPPIPQDNISAQALEAQEKILVRPISKPVLAQKKAEPAPEPKTEIKKESFDAVKLAEKAAEPAKPVKPATPADDVYPIKPAVTPQQAPAGTYYIQLSSAPKGSDMQGTWRQLQGRYGQALAGLAPSFPEAEIAGKGTFVRIQAGPMSRDEANKRCAALRAVNPSGGCLVIRK
jgi:hypothetical protein